MFFFYLKVDDLIYEQDLTNETEHKLFYFYYILPFYSSFSLCNA